MLSSIYINFDNRKPLVENGVPNFRCETKKKEGNVEVAPEPAAYG